jgi:hypothetical protein
MEPFRQSNLKYPACSKRISFTAGQKTGLMYITVAQGLATILIWVARFFPVQHTKSGKKVPNGRKIYQKATKYTNIFHCKTLQNLP